MSSITEAQFKYTLCDFQDLEERRATLYGRMIPSAANPIHVVRGINPGVFTDPSKYDNGYRGGRYEFDLAADLQRCQCPVTVLEYDKSLKPLKIKYEHPLQFTSTDGKAYDPVVNDTHNTVITGSCPNRLAITLKDEKVLYLVMTENGSMTDSIVSIHPTLTAAENNLKQLLDRKIEGWEWLDIEEGYIAKYVKPM
jgi:hypothetical protein